MKGNLLFVLAIIALVGSMMMFTGQSLSRSAASVIGFFAIMLLVVPFYFRRHDEL